MALPAVPGADAYHHSDVLAAFQPRARDGVLPPGALSGASRCHLHRMDADHSHHRASLRVDGLVSLADSLRRHTVAAAPAYRRGNGGAFRGRVSVLAERIAGVQQRVIIKKAAPAERLCTVRFVIQTLFDLTFHRLFIDVFAECVFE